MPLNIFLYMFWLVLVIVYVYTFAWTTWYTKPIDYETVTRNNNIIPACSADACLLLCDKCIEPHPCVCPECVSPCRRQMTLVSPIVGIKVKLITNANYRETSLSTNKKLMEGLIKTLVPLHSLSEEFTNVDDQEHVYISYEIGQLFQHPGIMTKSAIDALKKLYQPIVPRNGNNLRVITAGTVITVTGISYTIPNGHVLLFSE